MLLLGGGLALDRVLTSAVTSNFDAGLEYVMTQMIASAEIGPDGEVRLNRPMGDQRFLEPYSGMYWQISGEGFDLFRSRSLWDQALRVNPAHGDEKSHFYDSYELPDEQLRIVERDIYLPTSKTRI